MCGLPEPYLLKSTAELYQQLSRRNYYVILEDGDEFQLRFPTGNYHHFVGLHKFSDIAEVTIDKPKKRTAKSIYQDILHGNITEYDLQRSRHYNADVISDRLMAFLHIEDLLCEGAYVIVSYEESALPFRSCINGDLLLFRMTITLTIGATYMHLFFRKDINCGYYFPISFFEYVGDAYIRNQRQYGIRSIVVTTRNHNTRKLEGGRI